MRFFKVNIFLPALVVLAPFFSNAAGTNMTRLAPGPNDGHIAYVTARLMETFHYSQQPLDAEMSAKFFDSYLESLDSRHENFLQSDLAEFDHYRTNLDTLTLGGNRGDADLAPAHEIFRRFLERFGQHTDYVNGLLKQDKFKFNTDESFLIDRRHAPYPKDLDEAKQIWRQRLHYEFLQEKLSREISPTNSQQILPLARTNLTDIADTLARHYRWNLHVYANWDSTDVLQYYLNALAHAYDPHSDYLNNSHAQDFSITMSLSLFGIGAQLTEDDGYCTISSLIPGGPAAKSKELKEKDRVVAVAQGSKPPVDVVDMELDRVVQLIRGNKGTEVRLTISPAEDRTLRRVVTLVRDEIKLEDQQAKARLIEMPNGHGATNRVGIIDLPSFYAPVGLSGNEGHSAPKFTSEDVAKLIKKLKQEKVAGIILDLRNNPGGSLEEAIKFTGLFIKDGPVVQTRNLDGQVLVDADTDSSVLYDGPLVVLINRLSASASEIAAAALQDYGRALVVGDISTFGKGTVQNLNPLRPYVLAATNDPGTAKITIHKFYRVSGASTQLRGVSSDIVLPDLLNYSTQYGESSLENPLSWDTITNADYNKLNLVQPYLDQLRQLSKVRVATNQEFTYVRQDIEQFQKLQMDKSATLNEREALKERQANQSRQKSRDTERNARPVPNEKIYDFTVQSSVEPGLPAPEPMIVTNYIGGRLMTNNGTVYSFDVNDSYFASNDIVRPTKDFTNFSGIKTPALTYKMPPETNAMVTNTQPDLTHYPALSRKIANPIVSKNFPSDPTLEEAENILEDYISLLSKSNTLIANH